MPRKQLPISQRHRKDCARRRDCSCPWRPRIRDASGKFRGRTWDTYAEAEQEYYELRAARPDPLADRTTTVAQWAERWLAQGRGPRGEWREGTLRQRRSSVRHVVRGVGHYQVTELRRDDVRAWVSRMRQAGTGPVAIQQAAEALHAMYSAWLDGDRILPRGNPVPPGIVKAQPRKEFTPLTTAQVHALAAAMPPEMTLMVETEAFYGARMSEIRALREEDIIFTGRDMLAPLAPQLAALAALPAEKYEARGPSLRWQRKLELDGRTPGPMKNARGNRTLPFPQWLAAAFAVQLERWPAVDGWLFTNRRVNHGRGLDPRPVGQTTYGRFLHIAAGKAGVTLPPKQCSHALRHHCVSVLRAKGWSDQDIGYWIGDTATTVGLVYGRPMPGAIGRISADLSTTRDAAPLVLRPDEVRDSCSQGHEYPPDVRRDADGGRRCKVCAAAAQRARYRRLKGA
jgi:integrase